MNGNMMTEKIAKQEQEIANLPHKPTIILFLNRKGGTGKSTSSANIAAALGLKGYKVLAIDIDSQGDLSKHLLPVELFDNCNSMTEALVSGDMASCIYESTAKNVDIVPGNKTLRIQEKDLKNNEYGVFRLKDIYDKLDTSKYDFVIIDPSPKQSILSSSALLIADTLIIPVESYLSTDPLPDLVEEIEFVQTKFNPTLDLGYVLLTKYEPRTKNGRMLATLRETPIFKDRVLETTIPKNTTLTECPAANTTIFDYSPNCTGAEAYMAATEEILKKLRL